MPKRKTAKTTKKTDGVPAKIQNQETKADEMIAKLAAGEDPNSAEPTPVAAEPKKEPTPTHPSPAEPATPATPATPADPVEPAAPAAKPAVNEPRVDPGAFNATPAAAPGGEDVAALTARLSTLEGKYNTETARLSTALQTSQNIIESQEAMIKRIQAGEGVADPTPVSTMKKLNPDDFSSYGSEMEGLAGLVNSLIDENTKLKAAQVAPTTGTQGESDRLKAAEEKISRIGNTVQMSAKQIYYTTLDNGIHDDSGKPEWEAINKDPKFAQWLMTEEPMTGIARKAILLKANQDMNADRVVAIFSEFKRSLNAMPTTDNQAGLGDQVVPDTAGAGNNDDVDPNASKQGMVTTEMLKKAKNDFVQGRIEEKDFDKIAADYQRSIAKGWVQPGG